MNNVICPVFIKNISDIEPSREYGAEACQFAKYCKCNTDECYYGDPCACANTRECGINESLHTNGSE